jgi:SAM-dependent methyltransferase
VKRFLQLAARYLPARLVRRLRALYRNVGFPDGYFRAITLDEHEIRTRDYEGWLYGGSEAWRGHGAFQLWFLKTMGLEPFHALLDVGCGPLRGGIHAIAYLDSDCYCGIDFNESFIRAAQERVRSEGLAAKNPRLLAIDDFELEHVPGRFDFALAFSVLNHCDDAQRRRFLVKVPDRLTPDGRFYVTHAAWFDDDWLTGTPLALTRVFRAAADVNSELRMADWGWPEVHAPVFPILELQRKP